MSPIRWLQKGEEDYRDMICSLFICGDMFKKILSQGEALKIVSHPQNRVQRKHTCSWGVTQLVLQHKFKNGFHFNHLE